MIQVCGDKQHIREGQVMTKNKISCSVAITTFNGEKYILDQLKSIEAQTIQPDEIIICDDCSTDKTVSVIENFSKNSLLNIQLIKNSDNLGFRKNYEKCFNLCSSDLIFYCDQDDVWCNNKIEVILKEFEKDSKLVFVFSDAFVTDEELNIIKDGEWSFDWTKLSNRQEFFDFVQTRNFPLGFQTAFRAGFCKSIMPFLSDPDGWIALCSPIFGNIKAISEKLVYYRRHEGATSNAYQMKKKNLLGMLNNLFSKPYQVYFTYPHAEWNNNRTILKYIQMNMDCCLSVDEIERHMSYLQDLNKAEEHNVFRRIQILKNLWRNGTYLDYRGNRTLFRIDCFYMIINSFIRKK